MEHPAPLRRETLEAQLVTDADRFVVGRYLRQREDAPAIAELEKLGERKIPGAAAVLADVFNALWSDELGFKAEDAVTPDRQYVKTLLEETAKTAAFEELHRNTNGKMLLSFVGTIEAGSTLLKFIPKEDSEKLQDISKAQAEADVAEQMAQGAEADVQALASAVDSAGGMTGAEAQAVADSLSQQWEQAQGTADAARAAANTKQAQVQALADTLMGKSGSAEAKKKTDDLRRLGIAAAKSAGKKVEELSKTINAWGIEPAELTQKPFPEALALLEKLRKSEDLKEFAALLGRLRAMAAKKAKSTSPTGSQRVPHQETGRDLQRLVPQELSRLTHPVLRAGFYQDWSRSSLRLRGTEEKKTFGRGLMIVAKDDSGSMSGSKAQWATGITLAVAHFAKLQHRGFGYILFDSHVHRADVYPDGKLSAEAMLSIAEARAGGGTDFERPLRRAIEMIRKEGLKKADILLITDGDCAVSTEFLKEIAAVKKELGVNIITIICDEGGSHCSDETVKKFSDRVERASSFSAEEAQKKVVDHL